MVHRVPCVALVLSISCIPAMLAHAQDRERAREVFEEAERQFEAGNFQLALEGFSRSRELAAGDERVEALLLFNIGRAQEELGRLEEAERTFSQFLADAPSDAPYREETMDRVRELRARLAVETEPAHTPEAAQPTDSPLFPLGVVTMSLGGAAIVAAVPLGVIALDGAATLEQRCIAGDCPSSEAGLIDQTRELSVATDVLWIAGASLVSVGAVLMAVGVVSREAGTDVSAWCAPSVGCSVQVRGRL